MSKNTPNQTDTTTSDTTTDTTTTDPSTDDAGSGGGESSEAPGGLRFDNLSGFQRDIVRALYAAEAWSPQSAVDVDTVREQLREYPHYNGEEPASNRYYPAALRLADRGWLSVDHALHDARRRHYHLTTHAHQILDAVTASPTDHHHPTSTTTTSDTTTEDSQ